MNRDVGSAGRWEWRAVKEGGEADVTFCGHSSGMSGCSRYVGEGQVASYNLFFFLFTPVCWFLSPSSVSISLSWCRVRVSCVLCIPSFDVALRQRCMTFS